MAHASDEVLQKAPIVPSGQEYGFGLVVNVFVCSVESNASSDEVVVVLAMFTGAYGVMADSVTFVCSMLSTGIVIDDARVVVSELVIDG